mmetsp:Transcript_57512/g.171163  ORF Transcript_57512/g.171163 Transcript_57512/m.171163 type:complete len:213 (-) Transcript_57512:674-1312(-)
MKSQMVTPWTSSRTTAIRRSSGTMIAPWVVTMFGCLKRRSTRISLHRSGSRTAASSNSPRGVFTATYIPQKMPLATSPKLPEPRLLLGKIWTSPSKIFHRSDLLISAIWDSWDLTSTPSKKSESKTAPELAVSGTDPDVDWVSCCASRKHPPPCSSLTRSRRNSASHRRLFSCKMSQKACRSSLSAKCLLMEAAITRPTRQTPFMNWFRAGS